MKQESHDGSHLSMEQRQVIQIGIENGSTKAAIARTIGKDPTTVAKEIRKHRQLKPRNTFGRPVVCAFMQTCKKKPCLDKCEHHQEPLCNRRDKTPGACNKCEKLSRCHFDHYFYNAKAADEEYRRDLVDFREGINLTTKERDRIGMIIAPLLKQGQSVYQILCAHPEITQCERTIYNYIESGVFKEKGVDNFSLKEQVNRKKFKEKYKKRKEPVSYIGRTYKDYLDFRTTHPDIPSAQMDTLYNHPSGPYLQTLIFEKVPFMIGFLHNEKTSASMAHSFDLLQERLGADLFSILLSLVLTDRGSEFEKHQLFEIAHDQTRTNIFYCDPMQSSQKPNVENNHNYVRDIIPNGYPMDTLTQEDIDLMFSHINSTPRKSLGGKTPYELFTFLYGADTAERLYIRSIDRDNVILDPSLLYSKNR